MQNIAGERVFSVGSDIPSHQLDDEGARPPLRMLRLFRYERDFAAHLLDDGVRLLPSVEHGAEI